MSPTVSEFENFFRDSSDVRRDIVLLSYLLAGVQVGGLARECNESRRPGQRPPPFRAELDAWTHLASILTTGATGDQEDATGDQVQVAVTGMLESDTITAAVVTPSVSPSSTPDSSTSQFVVSKLQAEHTGLEILRNYYSTSMDVAYSEHAVDVFAILKHLFAPKSIVSASDRQEVISGRAIAFTAFISRRCYRRLRARITQGTRMWTKHPLELMQLWYHDPKRRKLKSKKIRLPSHLRALLAEHGLLSDGDGVPSREGELNYTISHDTAVAWVDMLHGVLATMQKVYWSLDDWAPDETLAMYKAYIILHHTLTCGILEHLITPGLADDLAEKCQRGAQSRPDTLGEAIMIAASDHATTSLTASAGSAAMGNVKAKDKHESGSDEHRDDRDNYRLHQFDEVAEDIPLTGAAAREAVVCYLQTLCFPFTAARFYVLYGLGMAERHGGIQLQAYMISSKLSMPLISTTTFHDFALNFSERFSFPEVDRDVLISAFDTLARSLERGPLDATEHPEATLMALACLSRDSDTIIVDSMAPSLSTTSVQSIFQASRIPIGVSKQCCFCCYTLATLLKERAAFDFVLQETHSVIVPWVPPVGIPAEVLTDLRLALVRVLYDTVAEVADSLRSAQTASADSGSPSSDPNLVPPGLTLPQRQLVPFEVR